MLQSTCTYCGQSYIQEKDETRCKECDQKFKEVMRKLAKKYESSIKGLADR